MTNNQMFLTLVCYNVTLFGSLFLDSKRIDISNMVFDFNFLEIFIIFAGFIYVFETFSEVFREPHY